MHFHKYPHLSNYSFVSNCSQPSEFDLGTGNLRAEIHSFAHGIHRIQIVGPFWPENPMLQPLDPPIDGACEGTLNTIEVQPGFHIQLRDSSGEVILQSAAGMGFGQNGKGSVFVFQRTTGMRFYGMGEKWSGLEHSDKSVKFWNTDVWADFHRNSYERLEPAPDPVYVSIPYLIIKTQKGWVGMLLDNPYSTFMQTGMQATVAGQMGLASDTTREIFCLGAEEGRPVLYILHGATLAELTNRFQQLVGPTPLPPAWALGYQQCRWGYKSAEDLRELDEKMRQHAIPCDGLWLDIDYMRGFRVFTFDEKHFPEPRADIARLQASGRKVVPIIDPGVKREPGYTVYDSGLSNGAFCKNPQGSDYVGLVWPGETVFPDFSSPVGQRWWQGHVSKFAQLGIRGAWLDMNDPATGPVENADMLFEGGRTPHSAFHNQYALGMAMATKNGFLDAYPNERPFLLSRSGFTGIQRHAAIWTGDNYSNWEHLRGCISTTLNLALSGVPFNGPDVGGFAGDTTPELMKSWTRACFLFPFFRNHSIKDSRLQEPWAFDAETLEVVRHFIRLRYKFRPYLYNLFARHEQTGDAILRPIFYDFESSSEFCFDLVDDEFLVGPAILHAPLLQPEAFEREVILPGPGYWYNSLVREWVKGPSRVKVTPDKIHTPIFFLEGHIIALARDEDVVTGTFAPERVDLHIFLRNEPGLTATGQHFADDGVTFEYREGMRTVLDIFARVNSAGQLEIETRYPKFGFGECDLRFALYDDFSEVRLNGQICPNGKLVPRVK